MTPLQKKWAAKRLDADDIYNHDDKSITFIYDPRTDKLYSAPYDDAHPDVADKQFDKEQLKELGWPSRTRMLQKGYILGRMGHLIWSKQEDGPTRYDKPDSFVIPVIAFWNREGFTDAQIKRALEKLAEDYPDYFVANSDEIIVTGEKGEGVKTSFLSDWGVSFSGEEYKKKEESPECKDLENLEVGSQSFKLQDILGALHGKPKAGKEIGTLRSAFCSVYPHKKQSAEKSDCPTQSSMIDSLAYKLQCDKQDWKKDYQLAKISGRQELEDIFKNLDKLPTKSGHAPTQSEIDTAWDEFSFKKWLQKQQEPPLRAGLKEMPKQPVSPEEKKEIEKKLYRIYRYGESS